MGGKWDLLISYGGVCAEVLKFKARGMIHYNRQIWCSSEADKTRITEDVEDKRSKLSDQTRKLFLCSDISDDPSSIVLLCMDCIPAILPNDRSDGSILIFFPLVRKKNRQ